MPATGAEQSLSAWRQQVAVDLAAAIGVPNAYTAVPRAPVRPCVIVSQGDPYIMPEGRLHRVSYLAVIVAGDEVPEQAADELDGYLDVLMVPADSSIIIEEVTGMAAWSMAGGTYPGVSLRLGLPLCFTDTTPPEE